jgi:hypothetical protein
MKTISLVLALALALAPALLSAGPGFAQTTAAKTWSGSASCDVTVTGPGYSDQQKHQWTLTGGAPTKSGAFDIYPGTWSVTGGGSLERTQGSQTLHAEWKRSVAAMSAPISVVVRASDGAILIGAGHAQLRAANAVTGTQEVRVDGKVTSHSQIGLEAFEYAFPSSQGAAKSTQVSGQKSDSPSGSFGPMQPAGSKVQVRCSWSFQQGGAAGVPQSSSAASNATSTPAGGGHPTLAPAGTATPTTPPTGASSNQTIQAPGAGGNYRTPPVPPPSATPSDGNAIPRDSTPASTAPTDCNQVLADVAAQYQAAEANIELMYAKLLQDNAANRAQLSAQLAALLAAKKSPSNPSVQAQIKALQDQIKELDAERASLEETKRKELEEEQKNADRAYMQAQRQCEAAKASP